jgi:hypothetical protein
VLLSHPSSNSHLQAACARDDIENFVGRKLELLRDRMKGGLSDIRDRDARKTRAARKRPFREEHTMALIEPLGRALKIDIPEKAGACPSDYHLDGLLKASGAFLTLPGVPAGCLDFFGVVVLELKANKELCGIVHLRIDTNKEALFRIDPEEKGGI